MPVTIRRGPSGRTVRVVEQTPVHSSPPTQFNQLVSEEAGRLNAHARQHGGTNQSVIEQARQELLVSDKVVFDKPLVKVVDISSTRNIQL